MNSYEIIIVATEPTPGLLWTIQRVITKGGLEHQSSVRAEVIPESEFPKILAESLLEETVCERYLILPAYAIRDDFCWADPRHRMRVVTILPALVDCPGNESCFARSVDVMEVLIEWVRSNHPNAVLIIRDSAQLTGLAALAEAAHLKLTDLNSVGIGTVETDACTAVLLVESFADDVALTSAIDQLQVSGFEEVIVLGVHADFSPGGYQRIISKGIYKIITCHTIPHESNVIDIAPVLLKEILPINFEIE